MRFHSACSPLDLGIDRKSISALLDLIAIWGIDEQLNAKRGMNASANSALVIDHSMYYKQLEMGSLQVSIRKSALPKHHTNAIEPVPK